MLGGFKKTKNKQQKHNNIEYTECMELQKKGETPPKQHQCTQSLITSQEFQEIVEEPATQRVGVAVHSMVIPEPPQAAAVSDSDEAMGAEALMGAGRTS